MAEAQEGIESEGNLRFCKKKQRRQDFKGKDKRKQRKTILMTAPQNKNVAHVGGTSGRTAPDRGDKAPKKKAPGPSHRGTAQLRTFLGF